MKKMKLKLLTGLLLATMVGATLTGCGGGSEAESANGTVISISGSTSVGPLMEKVQEVFESQNSGVTIEIQQNGSGAGVKDAMSGVSEIGMVSRELKDDETGIDETVVAHDCIVVLTHPNNPVKDITLSQIKDIYTGKIKNWKEIGGNDAPIVAISREDGSGTRSAFQEIIGFESEELIKDATVVDASGAVQSSVSSNENAIGYASLEYVNETVAALNVEGVAPAAEAVKDGSYKIARPFILVTKEDTLTENGKKLVDFILSEEGQTIVEENKLVTVE